jgi:hypothetical protein
MKFKYPSWFVTVANCPTTREPATSSARLFVEVLTTLKTDALEAHAFLSALLSKKETVGVERETPET